MPQWQCVTSHESWACTARAIGWGCPALEPQCRSAEQSRVCTLLCIVWKCHQTDESFHYCLPYCWHSLHSPGFHGCCPVRFIEGGDLVHLLRHGRQHQGSTVRVLHLVSEQHCALHVSDFLKVQKDTNMKWKSLTGYRQAKFLPAPAESLARHAAYHGAGGAGPDVGHACALHRAVLAVRQVLALGNGGTVILAVILDNVSGLADAFDPGLWVFIKHDKISLEISLSLQQHIGQWKLPGKGYVWASYYVTVKEHKCKIRMGKKQTSCSSYTFCDFLMVICIMFRIPLTRLVQRMGQFSGA